MAGVTHTPQTRPCGGDHRAAPRDCTGRTELRPSRARRRARGRRRSKPARGGGRAGLAPAPEQIALPGTTFFLLAAAGVVRAEVAVPSHSQRPAPVPLHLPGPSSSLPAGSAGAGAEFPRQPPCTQPGLRWPRRVRPRPREGPPRPHLAAAAGFPSRSARGVPRLQLTRPGSASPSPQPSPSRGFPLRLLAATSLGSAGSSGKEEEGGERRGGGEGREGSGSTGGGGGAGEAKAPTWAAEGLVRREEKEGRGQRKKEAAEPPRPRPGPAPLPSHHRRLRPAPGPGVRGEGSGPGALPARGGAGAGGRQGPASGGECPAGPGRVQAKGDPREEGRRPGSLGVGHRDRLAATAPPGVLEGPQSRAAEPPGTVSRSRLSSAESVHSPEGEAGSGEVRVRVRGWTPAESGAPERPGHFPRPGPQGKNVRLVVPGNPTRERGLGLPAAHPRLPLPERRLRASVLPESLGEETHCQQSQRILVNRLLGVLKHLPLHFKHCRDEFRRRFGGRSERHPCPERALTNFPLPPPRWEHRSQNKMAMNQRDNMPCDLNGGPAFSQATPSCVFLLSNLLFPPTSQPIWTPLSIQSPELISQQSI